MGKRYVTTCEFLAPDNGTLSIAATHFCVPIRDQEDRCNEQKLVEYINDVASELPDVIAGDLNLFGARAPIERLLEIGYSDGVEDMGPTFRGNDWAPQARLDYVFASSEFDSVQSVVERSNIVSDHFPVMVWYER